MTDSLRGDLSGVPETGLLVVGFSGGADSTALAHWLLGQVEPTRLVLAHVNHGLRGEEALRDEEETRAFAEKWGIQFKLLRADVRALAKERGIGLEACGREVRYSFFEELAPGENDRILTAHNADDNVETMLLNLCRGTGLSGLCGIPARRGKVLRPFLLVSRREIEAYCRDKELTYVTDSSNLSGKFARNRIRLEVLPVLRELNPLVVETMSRTASLLRQDRDYLYGEAEKLLAQAQRPFGLDTAVLLDAPTALRRMALRMWLLEGCPQNLERKHLEDAEGCLISGRAVPLPGGIILRRGGGLLYLERRPAGMNSGKVSKESSPVVVRVPETRGETALWGGKKLILEKRRLFSEKSTQKIHNLDFKNALDCDIITGNLIARTRREGDRFSLAGRGRAQSLKQVFWEIGIPAPLRGEMVLLECGGELIFCEGAGASERVRATEKTVFALFVTVENGKNEE